MWPVVKWLGHSSAGMAHFTLLNCNTNCTRLLVILLLTLAVTVVVIGASRKTEMQSTLEGWENAYLTAQILFCDSQYFKIHMH